MERRRTRGPHPQPERGRGRVRGDLGTGEGLEAALRGAETVIHCVSSSLRRTREVDVEGTGRHLGAAGKTGISHVVSISIFVVDRNPYYPYFRHKLETEKVFERSEIPWTILRATQLHEFALGFVWLLARGPVALAPKGLLGQPVDEVAEHLARLALPGKTARAWREGAQICRDGTRGEVT